MRHLTKKNTFDIIFQLNRQRTSPSISTSAVPLKRTVEPRSIIYGTRLRADTGRYVVDIRQSEPLGIYFRRQTFDTKDLEELFCKRLHVSK